MSMQEKIITMKNPKSLENKFSQFSKIAGFLVITGLSAMIFQSCASTFYVSNRPDIVRPPVWAPAYENADLIHYYYLPDIQAYYDVYNQEYVYLEEGNWRFSAFLPNYYSGFNINNAFVIVLNSQVHEPWMHHEIYESHYPRFYYQSSANTMNTRGYNENGRNLIYNGRNTTISNHTTTNANNSVINNHITRGNTDNSGTIKNNAPGKTNDTRLSSGDHYGANINSVPIQKEKVQPIPQKAQESDNVRKESSTGKTYRTAPLVYRSRNVGHAVKVTRDMKAPKTQHGNRKE